MKTYLFGHTSQETALEIKDYPYGFRLRTSIFYWLETAPKKGDRFCSYTINPKNGRMNAPKKSTYYPIGAMYRNETNGHIHWDVLSTYGEKEQVAAFAKAVGEANLNPEQMKMLRQMRGEKVVAADPITGDALKDFKIKWEGETELKITFDRPDGVSHREIFDAMKSVDQDRLNKVFAGVESKTFGHIDGFVRICVRKGIQLTTVRQDVYKEWLALDVVNQEA